MATPYREADEQRRWIMTWKVIGAVAFFYLLLQLMPLVVVLPGYLKMRWDAVMHPNYLLEPVLPVSSPDTRLRFVAERDGILRILESKSGKRLQTATLSPKDYRHIVARWKDNTHLELDASFRYPFKKKGYTFLWDMQNGKLKK